MGTELDEFGNEIIEEEYTSFPYQRMHGMGGQNLGPFAAWWRTVFSKETKPPVGRPRKPEPRGGDTSSPLIPNDMDGTGGMGGIAVSRGQINLPQIETTRRGRYRDVEKMDDYPEICSAFDIYADDATQEDSSGQIFKIDSETEIMRREAEKFIRTTRLDKYIWDIVRNVGKYGDCFIENVTNLKNPKMGIVRLKVLDPKYIFRIEDNYGYLQNYYQEIPKNGQTMDSNPGSLPLDEKNTIKLDKHQLIHFRRLTSDSNFYPYGKSIAASAIRTWRSLRLMEDAMLIYRLQRAPERRVFKIDIGTMPQSKGEAYLERVKAKFKKEKYWDTGTGTVNERYNPASVDEDFFVLTRNGKGTDIDVLPGGQNLGDIDDVKYWRDKVLAAMKVPKDFIVEKDKSPERKANLSQLDLKFSKAVSRLQRDVEVGIEEMFRRHLKLKGYPMAVIRSVSIRLQPPSDMHEKRRLELDQAKLMVVSQMQGLQLFDDEYIYKEYFGMSDSEINEMVARMKKRAEQEAAEQAAQQEAAMGGGAIPGDGADAAAGAEPTGAQ